MVEREEVGCIVCVEGVSNCEMMSMEIHLRTLKDVHLSVRYICRPGQEW